MSTQQSLRRHLLCTRNTVAAMAAAELAHDTICSLTMHCLLAFAKCATGKEVPITLSASSSRQRCSPFCQQMHTQAAWLWACTHSLSPRLVHSLWFCEETDQRVTTVCRMQQQVLPYSLTIGPSCTCVSCLASRPTGGLPACLYTCKVGKDLCPWLMSV